MGNWSLVGYGLLGAIINIALIIVGIGVTILTIVVLFRLYKVLGSARDFFDEIEENNQSLAQILMESALHNSAGMEKQNDNSKHSENLSGTRERNKAVINVFQKTGWPSEKIAALLGYPEYEVDAVITAYQNK